MFTLPFFINKKNKIWMGLLCAVGFYFAYSLPNQNHLFEPMYLSMTWIDNAIPFIPSTIILYMSEYVLFVMAYLIFKSDLNRNKYLCAYYGTLFAGAFFFVFFPTTYPRASFPLPTNLSLPIDALFSFLRLVDDPSNCFPSMHVACCYLTTFAFLDKSEKRSTFWIYLVWSTLISISTMTTKQHYFADIVGGFVLASVAYWIFYTKVDYLPWPEYVRLKKNLLASNNDSSSSIIASSKVQDEQIAKSELDSLDN